MPFDHDNKTLESREDLRKKDKTTERQTKHVLQQMDINENEIRKGRETKRTRRK